MAVRYYLGPVLPLGLRNGRQVQGSPLLLVFDRAQGERVTILKMNTSVGETRLAIHRYEASAARIASADSHPQLIPLPTDKDGRWSTAALNALERVGISRRAAQTSTREIAQLILANQRGRAFDEADRTRIVMGFEDL